MKDDDYKPENALVWALGFITILILLSCGPAVFDFFSALPDVLAIAEGR